MIVRVISVCRYIITYRQMSVFQSPKVSAKTQNSKTQSSPVHKKKKVLFKQAFHKSPLTPVHIQNIHTPPFKNNISVPLFRRISGERLHRLRNQISLQPRSFLTLSTKPKPSKPIPRTFRSSITLLTSHTSNRISCCSR